MRVHFISDRSPGAKESRWFLGAESPYQGNIKHAAFQKFEIATAGLLKVIVLVTENDKFQIGKLFPKKIRLLPRSPVNTHARGPSFSLASI